jgi:hypothetical protein
VSADPVGRCVGSGWLFRRCRTPKTKQPPDWEAERRVRGYERVT